MSEKRKKVLVTAGATTVPIDKVRAITNIFKGKTGTKIAEYFDDQGYDVTLITSNPELLDDDYDFEVVPYRTYDELFGTMKKEIKISNYDIIIHSAAVSDYKVDGVFTPDPDDDGNMTNTENTGKVSSSHSEIYLRLTQTEKIIDKIKGEWGFKGFLVKFKLEVDKTDIELIEIADKSMKTSDADMIVANCLEWSKERAYAISEDKVYSITRDEIASAIRGFYEHYIGDNR